MFVRFVASFKPLAHNQQSSILRLTKPNVAIKLVRSFKWSRV